MEWKVQNALNRDVERQHLNKILKEIEAAIHGSAAAPSAQEITRIVERVVRTESPDALTSVTVNISGDVSGAGTTNTDGRVNINAVIDPSKLGIGDAPIDSSHYWRINGTWERVSDAVAGIQDITEPGIVVYRGDSPSFTSVMLEGVEGEIDVTNGDGQDLDTPVMEVSLADVEVVEGGTLKTTEFDSKGRRIEEDEADTDDLPEGDNNLYHTDERAQEAVGSILQDSDDIHFDWDENLPGISASLSDQVWDAISNVVNVVGTPVDADIIEYDTNLSGWVPKKNPRELLLDGGNF